MIVVGGAFGFGRSDLPRAAAEEASAEVTPSIDVPVAAVDPAQPGQWHLPGEATRLKPVPPPSSCPTDSRSSGLNKARDGFQGSPCVADDVVFAGSFDKHVHAIDVRTGKPIWKTAIGMTKASAAFHDGRVYVGNDLGKLVCLDARTGKEVWSFDTGGEITASASFYAETIFIPSQSGKITALDSSGRKLWGVRLRAAGVWKCRDRQR